MAATVRDYAILAAVVVGGGLLYMRGDAIEARGRTQAVAAYGLTDAEAEAYDGCTGALAGKKLRNGGSKVEFCGCLAKKGTQLLNDGHKQLAGDILSAALANGSHPPELPAQSYAGLGRNSQHVVLSVISATTQCLEEARTTCAQSDKACIDRAMSRLNRKS